MKKINNILINNYWEKYYKKTAYEKQSNFANFVIKKLKNKKKLYILDIACKWKRYFFFHKSGLNVVGFDQSKNVVNNNKIKFGNYFSKINFCKKKLKLKKKFNIFYIRFFFHAITEEMEKNFLKNLKITSNKKKSLFFL